MSELTDMSCEEFAHVAAELALGVLTGRERARAIAHLDQCGTCREHVRELSLTGEEMLGLLPSGEPPAGFETRVMGRLGARPRPGARTGHAGCWLPPRSPSPRWRAAWGWGLRGATSPPSPGISTAQSTLRSAALLTSAHLTAGRIFLYKGHPRWRDMTWTWTRARATGRSSASW